MLLVAEADEVELPLALVGDEVELPAAFSLIALVVLEAVVTSAKPELVAFCEVSAEAEPSAEESAAVVDEELLLLLPVARTTPTVAVSRTEMASMSQRRDVRRRGCVRGEAGEGSSSPSVLSRESVSVSEPVSLGCAGA